jgi:hypothetical protein
MISKQSVFKTLLYFAGSGILLAVIHYLVIITSPELNVHNILYAHGFLFIITIVAVFVVEFIAKKYHPGLTGFGFLGTSLFKMMGAIIFLMPILRGESLDKNSYVIQFFIIYFFYLFGEVLYLARKLRKQN